jgi:hypothetical protein
VEGCQVRSEVRRVTALVTGQYPSPDAYEFPVPFSSSRSRATCRSEAVTRSSYAVLSTATIEGVSVAFHLNGSSMSTQGEDRTALAFWPSRATYQRGKVENCPIDLDRVLTVYNLPCQLLQVCIIADVGKHSWSKDSLQNACHSSIE